MDGVHGLAFSHAPPAALPLPAAMPQQMGYYCPHTGGYYMPPPQMLFPHGAYPAVQPVAAAGHMDKENA
eukprot:2661351-Pleurochrysis_carterae.AAC.1